MMKVYVSAQTIICFNEAAKILGWQEEIYSVKSRFETFCKIMESEIDWVKEIVHRSQATSLEELILIIHDEYETDLMFGPIEIE